MSNIPEYLQTWLNDKVQNNTAYWQGEQDRTFDVLVATGISDGDLTRVDIGDAKYVRVEPLGMTFHVPSGGGISSIDNAGEPLDWVTVYGSMTMQKAIATLYTNNAELRRLAALPKYIAVMSANADALCDWMNEHAADDYALDKFDADDDGYMYAVMVREA